MLSLDFLRRIANLSRYFFGFCHKKAVCNGFLNKAYGLNDFTGKGTFNPKQDENRRLQNSCLVCSIPSLKLTART